MNRRPQPTIDADEGIAPDHAGDPVPATPSVLAVDDNPQSLTALSAVLSDLDCRLVLAQSGEEALRHVLGGSFALILLDVNMPGMNGYQTAEEIRRWPAARTTPIVFLTSADEDPEQLAKAYRSGAVDFVSRPVAAEILRAKVSAFLELAEAQQLRAELAERRRSEAALKKVNRDLTAAVGELEAFAHTVGHDLRSPLRAMQVFSSMLLAEERSGLSPEVRDHMARIATSSLKLGKRVDDLLAYTRLRHRRLRKRSLGPSELAGHALSRLGALRAGREVEVIIDEMPPCHGDPDLLQQLFEELLANALESTRRAERARIEVGGAPGPEITTYFVKDNGRGFDLARAHNIFELFQPLHHEEDRTGTGAGLAFARRIVQRHGGRIWAESRPDQGATFFFTLEGEDTDD